MKLFVVTFSVVLCDANTAPMVKHANITKWPEANSPMLPGNTTVTYSCLPGYELENPNNTLAKCVYALKNRTGRPVDYKHQFVTAIWTGQESIRCNAGKH